MIPDWQTNRIYFSSRLKTDFPIAIANIERALLTSQIEPQFLNDTKDIWVRDFMPIQITKDQFVEYRYDPDYLQGHLKGFRDLKTYPDIVCDSIGLKTEKSELILDGGNFVKADDCIILTDKIVKENRFSYSQNELVKKIHDTFKVEKVVLIPWDTKEKFGHSDGVLRFIDNKTVLISNCYSPDKALLYRLKQARLETEFLKFKVKKKDKRNWAYINFLQTKGLILLPKFGVDEDDQSFDQISYYYPDYARNKRIVQVMISDIVRLGGALNCISWTIKA